MEGWLEFVSGPLFRLCFMIMVLGFLRNLGVAVAGMIQAYMRAGDKNVPVGEAIKRTLAWLLPITHYRMKFLFSLASFLFHLSFILVAVFLFEHVQLWKHATGVSWPSLPKSLADNLALLGIITCVIIFFDRLTSVQTRYISRFEDKALPILLIIPLISGYLAAHPSLNPFPYRSMLFVHILFGDIVIFVTPFTKLSHIILWPLARLATEIGWKFPPDAGQKVVAVLGKEDKV